MLPPLTHSKSRGSLNGRYAKKQLPYLLRVPVHSTLTDNWKTKVHRGKTVWCNERVKSNLMVITPTASHLTTFLWHYFEPHDIYLFHLGTLCLHHAHIAQSLYTYYVWYCPAFKCLLYPHSMYIAYWVFWHSVLFCWCYFALHACRIATPHLMNSSVSDCEMLNIHLAEFLRMFHIFMIRLLAAADFHMQQSFRSPSSFGCFWIFTVKLNYRIFLVLLFFSVQKSLLSRAVNQPSREGCWAMALPPRSPVEDGHRGGCPWRPRLSNAVSMMPKNDWFHGSGQCSLAAQGESRLHLGEETLAACEMLLNRVIARVIVWPVTPPSPSSRNLQPGLVLHVENIRSEFILCLSLSYSLCAFCEAVVNLQTTMSWFEKWSSKDTAPDSWRFCE